MKKKEKVDVIQTPSKIVSAVFTIPTSFSYESVKVEISGITSNDELIEKYNELVEMFRPAPKPVPVKEPFKPYNMPRKENVVDSKESGPDDATIELQKQDIVALLEKNHDFICKGKDREEIAEKVKDITGFTLAEVNYEKIIDGLK